MTDKLPSILILSGVRGDTRRYRTFHLYEQTQLIGLDSQISHVTHGGLQKKVENASIVILHRASFNPQIAWLEKEIHGKAGILIQDIDDLLFEPNSFKYIQSIDFSDPVRSSLYQEEMGLYQKTVEACDAVTASTDYLAERIRLLGKPVCVHRNAFSLEMLYISEQAFHARQNTQARIVIGYASGTATHDQDFALIKPALKSILDRFPNVELRLVGPLDPGSDWGDLENRVHQLRLVPWRQLPVILAGFDINLAPLRTDNPFGQSKSEIKFVEAALVRVPTIASPSEAFRLAIKNTKTSFLAGETKEWEDALETLIQQPELRQQLGVAAFQDVVQHYHPAIRANELVETLGTLTDQKIGPGNIDYSANITSIGSTLSFWSSAQEEKTPTLLQMGWYSLHYRGLSVLSKQIWIFLRRLAAPIIPFQKAP
jgi:glycosyltransferase involved in cell wall biosynthesis